MVDLIAQNSAAHKTWSSPRPKLARLRLFFLLAQFTGSQFLPFTLVISAFSL